MQDYKNIVIQIIESISHLTQNENDDHEEMMLSNILKIIYSVFDADQVILFFGVPTLESDNVNTILSGKFKYSYNLSKNDINQDQLIQFIELVISEKEINIISETDQLKNKNEHQHDYTKLYNQDYFFREGITSMISIKIPNSLGIVLINFRKKKEFGKIEKEEILKISTALSFLIANAIKRWAVVQENLRLKRTTIAISKERTDNLLASEIAHNAGNIIAHLNILYASFKNKFNKYYRLKNNAPTVKTLEFLSQIEFPLHRLRTNFSKLSIHRGMNNLEKKELTTLDDLVKSALGLIEFTLIKRSKVIIEYRQKFNYIKVKCVESLIVDSIINIIINALEAIPIKHKGQIVINTSVDSVGLFGIITIMDDGQGIPKSIKPFIFTPNFTTKKHGTGLGLFSSKSIIEDYHNGKLNLSEKRDRKKGACFEIHLPLAN